MKALRSWVLRLAGLLPSDRRERELEEEIESNLLLHIDDNMRRGMSEANARRDALVKLGGISTAKEAYRERSTVPFLENALRDIRFAMRHLYKNPGFTFTAMLMLALGMAASVAIFAFVDAALIKPLPYRNPERLVGVFESVPSYPRGSVSYPNYLDWKKANQVFSSIDVFQRGGFRLNTSEGAEPAAGARVSDGFFRTLGVAPVIGRDFHTGEDLPGASRTVILSHAVWQRQYGGKDDVLGRSILLDGEPNTIIGVLPKDFHFMPAEPAEYWTALQARGCELRRGCHNLKGVARLNDGVTVETALANMKAIARRLELRYPDSNRDQGAAVIGLTDVIVGDIQPLLLALLGGAGLLLLIAAVNVASLLLVRSESRKREMAVRGALGASVSRLVGQCATEALVLVAGGTATGMMLAWWATQLLPKLIPAEILARAAFLAGAGLNIRVLAFGGIIAIAAAALFTVTPALRLRSEKVREGLADGSRGSAGLNWRRVGSKLVVAELAAAMVLLAGAGLLGKSVYLLSRVEVGFRPDQLATIEVAAPGSGYRKDEQAIALAREIVKRVESLPGVQSVGIANSVPITGNGNTTWLRVLGRPWHGEHNEMPQRDVSSGYLSAVGARLRRGRTFREDEDASKPRVAIINQSFARMYFPGENALGKEISYLSTPPVPIEIVGIVEDIREGPLNVAIPPVLYRPFNQSTDTQFGLVVRTSQAEQSVLPAIVAVIRNMDPGIVTKRGMMMRDKIDDSPAAYFHRSSAWMTGAFAAMALLLGVIGLYGVIAYSVSQRTREIGVRMALGAQRAAVYRLVLTEAGWLIAGGVIIGLGCSAAASSSIRGLLFGISAWDVPTLCAVAGVLSVAAFLASYIPARRAAALKPVDALRAE